MAFSSFVFIIGLILGSVVGALGADKGSKDINDLFTNYLITASDVLEGSYGGLTRKSDTKVMAWIEQEQWDFLNKRLSYIELSCK